MGNQFNRYNRLMDKIGYSCADKKASRVTEHVSYMLARSNKMFSYNKLPETLPARTLEMYFQCNGFTIFYEHRDSLYPFFGGLGGELDELYLPTIATIANPYLNLSVNVKIGKECVVVPNDSNYMGLLPLYNRYAEQLVEAEISLKLAQVNSRIVSLISAPDDNSKASAEEFLRKIWEGEQGIIGENAFLDGIRVQPYSNSGAVSNIKTIIESIQFIKASWFNEIGINANFNMKREALNSSESALNDDLLIPLVNDMLECRQEGIEKVNKMFGTSISVSLNSLWKNNFLEADLSLKRLENEVDEGVREDVTETPE